MAERMVDVAVEPFLEHNAEEWDTFVRQAGAPFLFERAYMGYHAHRFADASVIAREGSEIVALLPATSIGTTVSSHRGLTYGGLVYDDLRATRVLNVFGAVNEHYRERGFDRVEYKALPHIYHRYPREEDLYGLFRCGARLAVRTISSTVLLKGRRRFTESRRSGLRKASRAGVEVLEADAMAPFWEVLEAQLVDRHGTRPVHTLSELELLRSRFPQKIRLFTVCLDGSCLGGCVVYDTGRAAHAQYIASSVQGRNMGALDALFDKLLFVYEELGSTYFDFGHSTEEHGRVLNEGLIFQKEGFGARGIVYDTYCYSLTESEAL